MFDHRQPLPEYEKPPVVETLLAVQFKKLTTFTIGHFGLYWARIKERYPGIEVQPPIASIREEYGKRSPQHSGLRVEVVSKPEVRCWFVNEHGDKLIQVQTDRFIHNWRKAEGRSIYPRYATTKPDFLASWGDFCDFLSEVAISEPEVDQCEITYINHIELGEGIQSFGDVSKLIAGWSYSGDFLKQPEAVSVSSSFVIPENKGRLHISLQRAIRRADAKEVLQLTLTVRGAPSSSGYDGLAEWFDLGHEWIVRGFTDFTTEHMHRQWRRTS